jgi:transcriptional/translational regulatory protein YebC/TACO1
VDEDALMEVALTGGAEDISEDGEQWQITTDPHEFMAVRQALEEAGIGYASAELTMVPKTTVEVADENEAKKILRLMDQLEDNDDVQDVYANFDIPEVVLEAVAS